MKLFSVYKGIKESLNDLSQVLYNIGQYEKGKDKTSYIVPVIYIEMPKNLKVDYFHRGIKVAKGAEIKIHYVSYAPYHSIDKTIQDSAVLAHESKVSDIMAIMEGLELKDDSGRVIATAMIHSASNMQNYRETFVYSVLTYKCEIRDYGIEAVYEPLVVPIEVI